MVESLREEGMVGMEGKRRMDVMDLAFTLCSCVGFSSLVMLRPKDKIKTSKHTISCAKVFISDLRKSRSGRVEVGIPLAGQLSR